MIQSSYSDKKVQDGIDNKKIVGSDGKAIKQSETDTDTLQAVGIESDTIGVLNELAIESASYVQFYDENGDTFGQISYDSGLKEIFIGENASNPTVGFPKGDTVIFHDEIEIQGTQANQSAILLDNARYFGAKNSSGTEERLFGITGGDRVLIGGLDGTSGKVEFQAGANTILSLNTSGQVNLKQGNFDVEGNEFFSSTSDTVPFNDFVQTDSGIEFPDGSVQTSASSSGKVKSAVSLSKNVSKNVNHGLSDTFVHVTVYDSNLQQATIDNVTLVDSSTVQLVSKTDISGTVVISK